MTTKPTDPSDKALDAAADGNFGGKHTNRRAGYGDQMDMILRIARRGGTLAAGEGLKLIEHYEALVRKAYQEGWYDQANAHISAWDYGNETHLRMAEGEGYDWDASEAKASL